MKKDLIKQILDKNFSDVKLFTTLGEEIINKKEMIKIFDDYILITNSGIEKYIDIDDIKKIEIIINNDLRDDINSFLSKNKW